MKTRLIALVLCLALFIGLMAGCSQSSGSAAAATTAGTTAAATTQAAAAATTTAAAPAADDRLAYLNTHSQWPIVKDGYDVHLDIYTTQGNGCAADYEENWYMHYLEDVSGLDISWTQIQEDSVKEQKSLLLASGALPDIMIYFNFSAMDLSEYGESQGLLLNMAPYITSELTPTIVQRFEEMPEGKAACTMPSGNIYTLPRLDGSHQAGYSTHDFYNKTYLDAMGMEIPTTLDEAIKVLYAFKEQDPAGQGAANLPIAAANSYWMDCTTYFLQAFGFVGGGNGAKLCLKDNKVVYCSYDDLFVEYLKIMNGFFNDGIISKDYYTMDTTALTALAAEGNCLLVSGPPYCLVTDRWDEYECYIPLTSQYVDKPQVGYAFPHFVGQFVISAETEYPEACMRFGDYFFTDEAAAFQRRGPCADYPFEDYGILDPSIDVGWHVDADNNIMYGDLTWGEYQAKGENDNRAWAFFMIAGNEPVGITSDYYLGKNYNTLSLLKHFQGEGWQDQEYNPADPDNNYVMKVDLALRDYGVDCLPTSVLYFDTETSKKISDISTLVNEHAKTEIAKFVTGARPLDEFGAFQEELKNYGVEDYIKLYDDAYTAYKANLK